MQRVKHTLFASGFAAVTVLLSICSSSATPFTSASAQAVLVAQSDRTTPITEVRSRRGGGVAAGIIGGMILGGIIASQRPYYYEYPPYGYYPYPYADGAIAYCMRRFRSYDPYTMTYLGYDGFRHPCP